MFSALDENEFDIVIDAMGEKVTQEGENIIKEGEMGEVLYVVEEGELDCYKQFVTTTFT
jgi:cAMP-dependent protein kinase regulator